MTISEEVEDALKSLLVICEKYNVALSGVIESQSKTIATFANQVEFKTVRGDSIQRLIANKGDVNQYLLELSQIDVISKQRKKAVAEISELNERVLSFQSSNQQVTKTKH